jgi:4-amino-4-deoxy-L-arabinose transferase-like glycosyltransferase
MRADDAVKTRWVLLFSALLFSWNLWGYDLWAPDEPFFGEGAREMLSDGHWLVPHVNGEVNTHKPPLFFWLIALFSLPLGEVTSVTARLPSVLAALGSVYLTVRLGRRTSGPRTGALAGAMLATTHMFWDKARWAQIDSLLCFFVLVALSAFESFRAGTGGRRAGLLFWAAAGLAVLAKGPVGVLLPLGVALLTLALDRDLGSWRRFAPFSGPAAFVAVLAPWVVATMIWGGEYSVWGALREHFVDRAVHGMHHAQPFWYYATVLPYALLPWSFLVFGAFLLAWRRRREGDDRFLMTWAVFVVLFFSVSTEKRDLYVLPAVPAFALLTARLVGALAGWWPAGDGARGAVPGPRWVTVPLGIVAAILVAGGIAAPLAVRKLDDALVAPAWGLGAVLLLGGLAVAAAAASGRALPAVYRTAGAMAVTMVAAVTFVYPPLDADKSGRELARVVREETAASRSAGRQVLALDVRHVPKSVNFYSGGVYLEELADEGELAARLAAADSADTYVLTNEEVLRDLPEALRRRIEIVYSTRLSRKDVVLLRVGE